MPKKFIEISRVKFPYGHRHEGRQGHWTQMDRDSDTNGQEHKWRGTQMNRDIDGLGHRRTETLADTDNIRTGRGTQTDRDRDGQGKGHRQTGTGTQTNRERDSDTDGRGRETDGL